MLVGLTIGDSGGGQIHQPMILGHGHTGQGVLEDRVVTHGDGGDLHHGRLADLTVGAGIFAEGAIVLANTGDGAAFDNDFSGSGNLNINRLALDHLHSLAAQTASHTHLIGTQSGAALGGNGDNRIAADNGSDFGAVAVILIALDNGAQIPALGGEAGHMVLIQQQHTVHGGVALAGNRILGDLNASRDVGTQILGKVGQDGQLVQIDIVTCDDNFVYGGCPYPLPSPAQ